MTATIGRLVAEELNLTKPERARSARRDSRPTPKRWVRRSIASPTTTLDHRCLDLTPLDSEPLGVTLAEGHHLSAPSAITVDDVITEPAFDFPAADHDWRDHSSGANFRPSLADEPIQSDLRSDP